MAQWPDCRTSVCGRCNTGLQLRVDPAFFCRSDHSDETMEIAILQKLGLAASSIAGCSVVCNVRKVDRSPEFRAQRGTFAPSLFLPGPGCTPGRSHASIPVPVHLFCHNSCLTGIITLHLLLAWCGRPSCCRRGGFGSELSPPLSSSPSEPTIRIRPQGRLLVGLCDPPWASLAWPFCLPTLPHPPHAPLVVFGLPRRPSPSQSFPPSPHRMTLSLGLPVKRKVENEDLAAGEN
jgi:hypothetical protein